MTIWHEEYRGYRVSYQGSDRHALILPTGADAPLIPQLEADAGEGRIELRQKAHGEIDAAIAAHGMTQEAAVKCFLERYHARQNVGS